MNDKYDLPYLKSLINWLKYINRYINIKHIIIKWWE